LIQRAKSGALEFGCFAQDDTSVFYLENCGGSGIAAAPKSGRNECGGSALDEMKVSKKPWLLPR
jgi:hypothetical protein